MSRRVLTEKHPPGKLLLNQSLLTCSIAEAAEYNNTGPGLQKVSGGDTTSQDSSGAVCLDESVCRGVGVCFLSVRHLVLLNRCDRNRDTRHVGWTLFVVSDFLRVCNSSFR